jgi:CRP-like cAMP-binding protein
MSGILIQKLKRLRFLSSLSDSVLENLVSCGTLRRYQRSGPVYVQDDEPKAAHLIVSGMANREATQQGDIVAQHLRAFAGDWLGLANITSRLVPYMHSAIAADDSEILSIDIPGFSALRANPEFSHYLLQVIGREQLVEEELRLNSLSSARTYDKLIRFLATELDRMQKRGGPLIRTPAVVGTQRYLAKVIGTTRETVNRDLQPLIAAGIIQRTQGVRPIGYFILNQDELAALAASPMRRNALYQSVRGLKMHRRYSDVA